MTEHLPTPLARPQLSKSPAGIQGLDEITNGSLPTGRSTLIRGSAGCAKTLPAMEFLACGITQYNESGVFMAFEEAAQDLTNNVASRGFDLDDLVTCKQLVIDFVHIERSEIEEAGEFDLKGSVDPARSGD
jgi:circadian clock protein KaiC